MHCCLPKDELPESLRLQFPLLVKRLHLATYNRVLQEQQSQMSKNSDYEKLSNFACHAASLAVRKQFKQDEEGNWHLKPVGPEVNAG